MSCQVQHIRQKIDSFKQILSTESSLNCIIHDFSDKAIKSLESFNSNQKDGILYGKTIAVKNNINIKGTNINCSSDILKDYISPYDATVVNKINKNGGIILGTTNMDEFAMGSSTEYSIYGPTINTYGNNCVSGGSSGGSAVSVASGMVDLALGSDTGGSVRVPASFCALFGIRPTHNRINTEGVYPMAPSFDTLGCFLRTLISLIKSALFF